MLVNVPLFRLFFFCTLYYNSVCNFINNACRTFIIHLLQSNIIVCHPIIIEHNKAKNIHLFKIVTISYFNLLYFHPFTNLIQHYTINVIFPSTIMPDLTFRSDFIFPRTSSVRNLAGGRSLPLSTCSTTTGVAKNDDTFH